MSTIWWCPCVELSLVLLEEGVCYDQCVLLRKLYWPFRCFILHSKAKLACYSRYLLTTYFCIPNTNEWWHCYICWEGVQMNMWKNWFEHESIFLSLWVESYYRLSFALSSLSALQEPSNLWQLSYGVLYEGCFNHRSFCCFSLSQFPSKHFIILFAKTPPLLTAFHLYVPYAASSNNHVIIQKKRQTCIWARPYSK